MADPKEWVYKLTNDGNGSEFGGEGAVVFEAKAAGSDTWPTGVTLKLQKRSPFPSEETVWKDTGQEFSDEGTLPEGGFNLIAKQRYRFVKSGTGAVQCWMHAVLTATLSSIKGVR